MATKPIIVDVTPDGQADKLGFKEGDVIISVNSIEVSSDKDFGNRVAALKTEGYMSYTLVLSNGKEASIYLSSPLGVMLNTVDYDTRELIDSYVNSSAVSGVIVTTASTVYARRIEREIEIVSAEVVYGMNAFKDLFAGVRNIVGGRSKAVEQTLNDAKKQVVKELKREAFNAGAEAVIGVDFEVGTIDAGGSMVVVTAYGTAVKLAAPNHE